MRKARKGITPVIATVLLMSISVAATAVAWEFMIGSQKQLKKNFQDQLTQEEKEQNSEINIQYVYRNSNGWTVMNVRNTGSISLEVRDDSGNKIWSLFAEGRPVGASGHGWKYVNAPKDILDPSEVLSVNTTVQFPAEGSEKTFKLIGQYGTTDSHVCFNSGEPSC